LLRGIKAKFAEANPPLKFKPEWRTNPPLKFKPEWRTNPPLKIEPE
jgi:hypothetical protein